MSKLVLFLMDQFNTPNQLIAYAIESHFTHLLQRANQLKLRELFEEPSTYEDELED